MASVRDKLMLDFNCPQYVDFLGDLEDKQGDTYLGGSSPLCQKTRNIDSEPENFLDEAEENQLMNKMTAALSVIENTPKLKKGVTKERLFPEQGPSGCASHQMKSVLKPSSRPTPIPFQRSRSRSVCVAVGFNTERKRNKPKVKPKRSSSVNDLRTVKKHTFPKTPVCLKRTIKAKAKETLKTTEEIELEQIALLQKELAQLLRNNEISYRRLKQKQKSDVQKKTECKPEISEGTSGISAENKPRRNLHTMSHAAIKKEASKLAAIVNSEAECSKIVKNIVKEVSDKSKNPSISSSILSEECGESKTTVSKMPLRLKTHSGLLFHGIVKKSTLVKPFSFDVKTDEAKSHNLELWGKSEISLSKSVSDSYVKEGKENIPASGVKLVAKKLTALQNVKSDIKQWKSDKKIVRQQFGNPVRGLPLAENSWRN